MPTSLIIRLAHEESRGRRGRDSFPLLQERIGFKDSEFTCDRHCGFLVSIRAASDRPQLCNVQGVRRHATAHQPFLDLANLPVGVSLVRGELEEAGSLALVLRQAPAIVSIEDPEIERLAVIRLRIRSNRTGSSTGRTAGIARAKSCRQFSAARGGSRCGEKAAAKATGGKRVCIPKRSTKSPQRTLGFRDGQKWRTGSEECIGDSSRARTGVCHS
jgi:hypothetical protein